MLERQRAIEKITELLATLQSKVKLSNSINLTDTNIHAENFYRDFLNLIFDYDLKNINSEEPNAAAIDLGDEQNKIAFQVTSTSTLTKSRNTVKTFIKRNLNLKYDKLIILNITEKKIHKEPFIGEEGIFQLDTSKDIWDLKDIIKKINSLDLDSINKIYLFLKKEISNKNEITISNEVSTFLSLIEILSDESQPSAGKGFIENPDPDLKIRKRFKEHEKFLTNIYTDLYSDYGFILEEVKRTSEIGPVKMRRLGTFLQIMSDRVLSESNDDPKLALEKLAMHFKDKLSENSSTYDEGAIHFFLIHQLIMCNVFPNKDL